MKSTSLRDEVLQNVCSAIQSECKSLCKAGPGAVSLLRKVSVSDMKAFTWQRLLLFLSKRAPVLLAIVKAAMQKSHSREFNSAAAGMAIAIMLNARNMFLCHTQAVLSVFLHHSGASKEVIYIYIYILQSILYIQDVVHTKLQYIHFDFRYSTFSTSCASALLTMPP